MSANILHDRTIALAGACQALAMVKQLARTGSVNEHDFNVMMSSIVFTDPDNVVDVYGSTSQLRQGFEVLSRQLNNKPHDKDNDLTRYLAGIMALERRLSKSTDGFSALGKRINEIKRQQQHFDLTENQMQANIAAVYTDIVSPLGAKIQIVGMPQQIQKRLVQDKIRALLLATMRSVVLWRQLGGRRRHLIFQRRKMLNSTKHFLITH
jgi:high frequency lysogenization protein